MPQPCRQWAWVAVVAVDAAWVTRVMLELMQPETVHLLFATIPIAQYTECQILYQQTQMYGVTAREAW